MAAAPQRVFEDSPAVREATPLIIGLDGPSGSGKTFSALRLATGIQRVVGGEIFFIDTEARRALHYADKFKFRHLPFGAPFSPLDYLAAIQHCVSKGGKTIVIDSLSHEHEGPGGVLEMHEQEVQRLAQLWNAKPSAVQMTAWSEPKKQRRRLINTILQLNVNLICCFRAKEKLKIQKGKDPIDMGWMPIAGEEFVFEMALCCLLLPGAKGVPTWQSDYPGERMMMKLPGQFVDLFGEVKQLDEATGQSLAEWSAGVTAPKAPTVSEYDRVFTSLGFQALESRRAPVWKSLSGTAQKPLKAASDAAKIRVDNSDGFDSATALRLIKEAGDLTLLDQVWLLIFSHFDARNEEVPNDFHAAYTFAKESLAK